MDIHILTIYLKYFLSKLFFQKKFGQKKLRHVGQIWMSILIFLVLVGGPAKIISNSVFFCRKNGVILHLTSWASANVKLQWRLDSLSCGQKHFWSNKFGKKKILVNNKFWTKNFWSAKILGKQKFLVSENLWSAKILGQQNFLVIQINFGQYEFLDINFKKIYLWSKILC